MTKLLATTTLLLTLLVSPLMAVEGKGLVCKCVKCDDYIKIDLIPDQLFQFGAEKVSQYFLQARNDKVSFNTSLSWDNYGRSSELIEWWSGSKDFFYTLYRKTLELIEEGKSSYNISHLYKCAVHDPSSFKKELKKFKSYYQSEYDKSQKKNKI